MTFGVVIVNYNGARLAIDAALSVLGDDPNSKVVIVDNASTDESQSYLADWARGALLHQSQHPKAQNADVTFASRDQIDVVTSGIEGAPHGADVTILQSRTNGGFAAGCNIGLRFLQQDTAIGHFLLLNPDALVQRGALSAFEERLRERAAGLCGATLMRFAERDCVQACGGAYLHPVTLLGANIAGEAAVKSAPPRADVERRMSYPLGAAIALRRDYLERAGFLNEDYFLYYEEADWTLQGRAHYRPVWADKAIVYHRHGASAGSRVAPTHRSAFADFHMTRSRLKFALRWRPWVVPVIVTLGLVQAARRVLRGRRENAKALLAASLLKKEWRGTPV